MYTRLTRNRNRSRLKAVSVARTVEASQEHFQEFLTTVGRELGQLASIRTITSTRLTFLESGGINMAARQSRMDSRAISRFSYWLSNRLDANRAQDIFVQVDRGQPFKIMGKRHDKLALNILEDEQLMAERANTEALLKEEFGELPKLKSFEPHITIGFVHPTALSVYEQRHPEILLPEDLSIPTHIALNGLSVYLDDKRLRH